MIPDLNPLEWGGVILYISAIIMMILVLCHVVETAWNQWIDASMARHQFNDDELDEALRKWSGR